jgi:hypothetical protein
MVEYVGVYRVFAAGAFSYVAAPASQTITFNSPGPQSLGTTPTLSATASSTLAVTFSSSTTGVCTITSGGALTFVTAGSCTINANQAGNGSFAAAPQGSRTFNVLAAPTVTILSPASDLTTGGATVTITGTDFTGATAVNFGSTAATNVTVVNATQITATAPAGSFGNVYVTGHCCISHP